MTVKRTLSALCAAALLLAGLAGCSTPAPVTSNSDDIAAVHAAMDKLKTCTSFTAVQETEQAESVTGDGMTVEYSSTSRMELTMATSPATQVIIKTTATATYDGESMTQSTESYIVPENGGYAEYYSDGTGWYVVTTEDAQALSGVSAASLASMFLADGMTFIKDGTETLEGSSAVRYKGTLQETALVYMLNNSGCLSSIVSMSESLQDRILENLEKDLPPLSIYVWVDSANGYPVRFEMDLASTLAAVNESINKTLGNKASEEEWSVTKYRMTLTLGNFDAAVEIVLPPEAANAVPYEQSAS